MAEQIQRRGEQTRQAIIQAAHDLFLQQGYHGTSMRQIARNAEIALGGLYNHFASKEEVFEAVFLEYHPYHEVIPLCWQRAPRRSSNSPRKRSAECWRPSMDSRNS